MLMLFVIGGLFYWLSTLKDEKFEVEKQITKQAATTTAKYSVFIKSCLEQATKEALVLLGQQGGLIYEANYHDQKTAKGIKLDPKDPKIYSTLQLPDKTDNKGVVLEVPFWITIPNFNIQYEPHPIPPEYPYGNVSLVAHPETKTPYFGNYPKSYLVPLCDSFGANSAFHISCGVYNLAYDSPGQEADHHSIQEYLQDYVREKTVTCIDLNTIEDLKGYDITEKEVEINITIGETDVTTKFSIPKLLKQKTNKNIQQIQDISITTKVRLKQLHEFLYNIIVNDITNIFFNVNVDFAGQNMIKCLDLNNNLVQCAKQGMAARRISGIKGSDNKHHSIIEISDEQSKINGKPYIFQVAVENRLPALDWINNYNVMEEKGLLTKDIMDEVDVLVFTGEKLIIDPKAYDPDEDFHGADNVMDVNYYYSGWGIDYVDINKHAIDPDLYSSCLPSEGSDIGNAKFILNGFGGCINEEQKIPNTFTFGEQEEKIEQPFIMEKQQGTERKIITYQPTVKDIGLHTLKIEVCDEIGCDFQAVRILVLPK